MSEDFAGGDTNSVGYWNKRFFEDWTAKGGREQTAFFAELCCRELPGWLVEEVRARQLAIFDYGCALGDALPILQRAFPQSTIRGGDIAQVGLGLARALYPDFEFTDVNAIDEAVKVADVVYCSNTLEHFTNWREVLLWLGAHAREFVVVVLPFEEDDRIDEHVCTFEFDTLPPRLQRGMRLLHLGVVDAGREPQTQWNGLQLIAIYGKKRRRGTRSQAAESGPRRAAATVLDLRGIRPAAMPPLLASLAAVSQEKRRFARELATIQEHRQAETAALTASDAMLRGVLREYADLTRGLEAAQRWLLERLDPDLLGQRPVSAVPEGWPEDLADMAALHRVTLARLIAAIERANRVGLAFGEQAGGWAADRAALQERVYRTVDLAQRQLAAQREALNGAIGDYADLTRGLEAAQRWLLERLDPDLLGQRPVSAVPEGWPEDLADAAALHRVTLARLIAAVERANRVGLAFGEQAGGWAADRAALQEWVRRTAELVQRQLGAQREALNGAIGDYADLARGLELAHHRLLDQIDPDGPQRHADAGAGHQAPLAGLLAAVDRANNLGLAFAQQAAAWRTQHAALRRAFEAAIGERDRMRALATRGPTTGAAARSRSTPLVSIVLPVYNQAHLVPQAIAGVVSQTYENWELIVVDDGSDDDLEGRVRHYLGERRVLFVRQPNQRLPAALNHGFAYARGDLLTWTSADNIMLPMQLERLVAELAAHPEAGLVYSDYWAIDDNGAPLAEPRWRPHNRDPEIADLIRLPAVTTIENFHRSGDNFIGASFLYRREVAEIVGCYADDAFGGEDYDFWLRMHLVTQFRHVAEPLYKYRVHADTLTSRAEELGLYANIREVVEADRWRIATLLTEEAVQCSASLLRPVEQFHAVIRKRCRPVLYSSLAGRDAAATGDGPLVVDIDVPVRTVDPAVLRHASLLLCRSELAASLLRRAEGTHDKRVLNWTGESTPAVQHAFMQAFAEQVTTPAIKSAPRVPARIDDPFRPRRILLVVERWASGGLENVVVDLAESLAAGGRFVIVASADGAPPPAAAFADPQIRTLAFRGDEGAFASLLESAAIEVVNYHHSRFAAEQARRRGVASVYTMHNCYLWMDEPARQAVAAGLATMDRLIAVSRQVAQFAAAQFRYPTGNMVVIPNGLRQQFVGPAAGPAFAVAGAPFTVAIVASFTRLKLQHIAIAAFADAARDIPELRLRLIGATMDPGYGAELQAQIAALPEADRIDLAAGLSRQETVAALAAAQAFLLPSLVEGCSMSLLEAVAAGCVCIASDVGGARDLQIAGGSVLLLPSPLGELDAVTQQQFLEAAAIPLPQHRANIAEALRTVWQDYGRFAAGVPDTRARLRQLHGMQQMTDAYLDAYAMARRGGRPPHRPTAPDPAISKAAARA